MSLSCASVLVGSPELVLPGRRCNAAMPLVFSWHQLAFHSPDAAGALLRKSDLPLAAAGPVPLDGGLWLSGWICDLTDTGQRLHTGSRKSTLATEPTETQGRSGTSAREGSR